MLYEEGKFLLTDPVGKYIPAFNKSFVAVPPPAGSPADLKYVTVPAKRQITIRDLMSHSSGLNYGDGIAKETYEKAKLTGWYFADREETIGDAMQRLGTLPLVSQPGEAWVYGYNTDVLGYLIEVVSGQPLDKFIEERVCRPLKMVDTSFFLPVEKADRLMPVYGLEDGKLLLKESSDKSDYIHGPRKCFSGGAGLLSTASDYGRLLQMLLNGGELDGVRILSPKTVALMHENHTGDRYTRDNQRLRARLLGHEGCGLLRRTWQRGLLWLGQRLLSAIFRRPSRAHGWHLFYTAASFRRPRSGEEVQGAEAIRRSSVPTPNRPLRHPFVPTPLRRSLTGSLLLSRRKLNDWRTSGRNLSTAGPNAVKA